MLVLAIGESELLLITRMVVKNLELLVKPGIKFLHSNKYTVLPH